MACPERGLPGCAFLQGMSHLALEYTALVWLAWIRWPSLEPDRYAAYMPV